MEAEKRSTHEEPARPRYLPRSDGYEYAETFRRHARGLVKLASEVSPEHAQLLQEAAFELERLSARFDAAADAVPVSDERELPFR